jgi:hypothetical protein
VGGRTWISSAVPGGGAGLPLPFSGTSAGRKSLVRLGLTCAELGGRAGRCCVLAYF